jgi:ABC-type nitrate/sulfonate/bicarbonate transport system permease component
MQSSDVYGTEVRRTWLVSRLRDFDYAGCTLRVLRVSLFAVALVGLWQVIYELEIWSRLLLPSPEQVWKQLRF